MSYEQIALDAHRDLRGLQRVIEEQRREIYQLQARLDQWQEYVGDLSERLAALERDV